MATYYGYQQGPPSPPFDDTTCSTAGKCSLPSISNLLHLAGQGSPTNENGPSTRSGQMASQRHLPPTELLSLKLSRPPTRPPSSQSDLDGSGLPPTPPMTTEASFSGYNSPSMKAASSRNIDRDSCEATPPPMYSSQPPAAPRMEQQLSTASAPCYYGQQPYQQPQQPHYQRSLPSVGYMYPSPRTVVHPTPPPDTRRSYFPHPLPGMGSFSSVPQSPQQQPSQQPSPQMAAQQPLPPPMPQHHQAHHQPHQQQHQQHQAPPQPQPAQWQHHHYISPGMATGFPMSQDRYVCGTCSKAFSRPSSLRIHSHSHTGEKPFKCPHQGCGKAFSVRSNMKRHERGCHSYESPN